MAVSENCSMRHMASESEIDPPEDFFRSLISKPALNLNPVAGEYSEHVWAT
jgi:hypothetical protein